ncbi:MAG TPA: iron uptake transporter permease EfeU [Candidatus Limnocylindrales bacterium]|jgi:high-affinity iron transporter|nr:iron uptake transporter permease EfeU [Candidatus Limnocylindrales bacterium]
MDLGALSSGLLTGLREGVEAALIIAIICAYLARTGNQRHLGVVLLGAGGAIVLSAVLGFVLYQTVGGLEEPYEQIFEAATLLLAAAVVTWMLFWMRRQARSVKGDLHAAVDRALGQDSVIALGVLAFVAVIREGLETSLFLVGQANSAKQDAIFVLVGALIGLAAAAVLGVGFYQGSRRLNLATFFRWTGVGLIFIAAGLLSTAVHELIEIGVIPFGTQTLFDLSGVLPHDPAAGNLVGQFLRALFGYSATPEVTTFVAWLAYIVVVLALFLRPTRLSPAPATTPATTPTAPARG